MCEVQQYFFSLSIGSGFTCSPKKCLILITVCLNTPQGQYKLRCSTVTNVLIIPFFLTPSMVNEGVLLRGKIKCWSGTKNF